MTVDQYLLKYADVLKDLGAVEDFGTLEPDLRVRLPEAAGRLAGVVEICRILRGPAPAAETDANELGPVVRDVADE